jgi:hypothetical protein
MSDRPVHPFLVVLVALGVLVQSLWAGMPLGAGLCIGCERQGQWGWTVCDSHGAADDGCCESDDAEPALPVSPTAGSPEQCRCVVIPMGSGPVNLIASAPVLGSAMETCVVPHGECTLVLAVLAMLDPPHSSARAGPTWGDGPPPRLLAPAARRTVLIV